MIPGPLLYAVLCLWLLPAIFWRPVALALGCAWVAGEVWYRATGIFVPVPVYVIGDACVIAVTLMFRSHWTDWLILAIFPAMWLHYPEGSGAWWTLYWLALAQFVLAGPWTQAFGAIEKFTHGPKRAGGAV